VRWIRWTMCGLLVLGAGFAAGRLSTVTPAARVAAQPGEPPPQPPTRQGPECFQGLWTPPTGRQEMDGDTFRVAVDLGVVVYNVRLVGVNAPETERGPELDHEVTAYGLGEPRLLELGRIAKEKVRARLHDAKRLDIVLPSAGKAKMNLGRLDAYVELDGQDLGEWLIREGLAWRDERHRGDEIPERAARYDEANKHATGPR